jgi:hypothetical protein
MKATKRNTSRAEKIRRFITANPKMPLKDVAVKFDTRYQVVYMIKRNMEAKAATDLNTMIQEAQDAREKWQPPKLLPMPDVVNHPAHYKTGGIETIDFIEAKGLNYHLGNVVKYITRADHKGDRMENLLKAQWYLNREINRAKGE